MRHALMVAAENGALPGGKVGGIGDVVRDVPPALARRDYRVSVMTPAYGVFAQLDGARLVQTLTVDFAGSRQALGLYQLSSLDDSGQVCHYVIDHPNFAACGAGRIYCDDPPGRPFETDASKFALFSIGVAEAIRQNALGDIDVIHLHDWHAAFVLILRHYAPAYRALRSIRTVYSIHNLALQGIRPFAGPESSLDSWYPGLDYARKRLIDPEWSDCVNPMAAAIRLADAVHTVSPSYAREILLPANPASGQRGGERLDADLRNAREEKRLFGILNGCEYPQPPAGSIADWPALLGYLRRLLPLWISRSTHVASAHYLAERALDRLDDKKPPLLITSVGRITDQKVGLMRQATKKGVPALHAALDELGERGLMLMVGSGNTDYEQFLCETMVLRDNFVFLRGYSDDLAEALYRLGDLFFMPSSFEPCGISQMLAMRAGQPCLVHAVGGLRDTVKDKRNGFSFSAKTPEGRAQALVNTLKRAMTTFFDKPWDWQKISEAAAAERFSWDDSIDAYRRQLYQHR